MRTKQKKACDFPFHIEKEIIENLIVEFKKEVIERIKRERRAK